MDPKKAEKQQQCLKISVDSKNKCEINGSIRIGKPLEHNQNPKNQQESLPESLLSCLDELQNNGKLIAWKIKGHGKHLTVKVTWNKKPNKKTNQSTNSTLLGCPRVNASGRDTLPEDDSEIEVTKDSYFTSKNRLDKTINNAETKMEFWRFKGSFQNFLDKLEINFCMYKSGKLDKTEFGEILIKSRIQLSSIITRLIDGLNLGLQENCDYMETQMMEYDVKMIVIAEIEEHLKMEAGSLLKDIEESIESNGYANVFEDEVSDLVLSRLISQYHESYGNDNDRFDDSLTNGESNRKKKSINDSLMLSLNSLSDSKPIDYNLLGPHEEVYESCLNDIDETCSEGNWSFNSKKKSQSVLSIPVVMTLPESNEEILLDTPSNVEREQEIENTYSDYYLNNPTSIDSPLNSDSSSFDDFSSFKHASKDNEVDQTRGPVETVISNHSSKSPSSFFHENEQNLKAILLEPDEVKPDIVSNPAINTQSVQKPEDRLVRIGEPAKFKCKIQGHEAEGLFWFNDTKQKLVNNEKYEVYNDEDYFYLKIYNTIQNDSGTYSCMVENQPENCLASFTLNLRENNRSFKQPMFISNMQDVEIEEGLSAVFRVKIDYGYPKARVLFYRNDVMLLNDQKHKTYCCGDGVYELVVAGVNDCDNSQYTCFCVNNAGSATSKAELYVTEKEVIHKADTKPIENLSNTQSNEYNGFFSVYYNLAGTKAAQNHAILQETNRIKHELDSFSASDSCEVKNDFNPKNASVRQGQNKSKNKILIKKKTKKKIQVDYVDSDCAVQSETNSTSSALDYTRHKCASKSNDDDLVSQSYISQIQIEYLAKCPDGQSSDAHGYGIMTNSKNNTDLHETTSTSQIVDLSPELRSTSVAEYTCENSASRDGKLLGERMTDHRFHVNDPLNEPIIQVHRSNSTEANQHDPAQHIPSNIQKNNIFEKNPNFFVEIIGKEDPVAVIDKKESTSTADINDITHESLVNLNVVKSLKQKFDKKDDTVHKISSLTCRNFVKTSNKPIDQPSENSVKPTRISILDETNFTQPKENMSAGARSTVSVSEVKSAGDLLRNLAESGRYFKVYDSTDDKSLKEKYEKSSEHLIQNDEGPRQKNVQFVVETKSNDDDHEQSPSEIFADNVIFKKYCDNNTNTNKHAISDAKTNVNHQNDNYKRIIANNLTSVRKKNSVVLSKVNRWDKCFESGKLKPEYWDEDFLPN